MVKVFEVSAVAVPEVIDCVVMVPEPVFESNTKLLALPVHCAYNVTAASGIEKVTAPVPAYAVPLPLAAVFQPVNVKPVLVKVLAATVIVVA